jgi:hypothetical protein
MGRQVMDLLRDPLLHHQQNLSNVRLHLLARFCPFQANTARDSTDQVCLLLKPTFANRRPRAALDQLRTLHMGSSPSPPRTSCHHTALESKRGGKGRTRLSIPIAVSRPLVHPCHPTTLFIIVLPPYPTRSQHRTRLPTSPLVLMEQRQTLLLFMPSRRR